MVDRIQLILKVYNMTASKFADEIGVQRSGISHILSGRNMPSLDLIQKILRKFPDINPEWLLNGIGSMTKNAPPDLFNASDPITLAHQPEMKEIPILMEKQSENELNVQTSSSLTPEEMPSEVPVLEIKEEIKAPAGEKPKENAVKEEVVRKDREKRSVEKILVFYSDMTYTEIIP